MYNISMEYTSKTINRFLKHIMFDKNGCWIWNGVKNAKGYGRFRLNNKFVQAHRFSYRIYYGPFDEKLYVLHSCDQPSCCNSFHLFLGTHRDNMVDMSLKLRNHRLRKTNSSGKRGVSFNKKAKKWCVQIMINNKKHYLGLFETIEDASNAYENRLKITKG